MIYVLFHKNCMDGVAAAYAAWKKFGNNAVYKEIQYGDTFPIEQVSFSDVVYVLDFSFKRDFAIEKAKETNIIIIDHHISAKEDLEGLDFAIFNTEKSGGVLAWEYFHQNVEVPYFLRLLEDYDLWKWNLPETLNLTNRFQNDLQRLDFNYLDNLVRSCELYYKSEDFEEKYETQHCSEFSLTGKSSNINENKVIPSKLTFDVYLSMGKIAGEAMQKEMDSISKKKKLIIKEIDGKAVAFFNTTVFISMLGHAACQIENVDYSISYFFKEDGGIIFSFRSKNTSDIDVSELAKVLGGGGHKHAAGASVPYPKSLEVLKEFFDCKTIEL